MYRVLLVDDEPLILAALKAIIPWGELGFSIEGEAADGKSALALMESRPVDLVVSDIKMPGMSGIQMLGAMLERGVGAKVVFLSAYSDFVYTHEAIKFGAFDYLLKPIDDGELLEVLARFKQARPREAAKGAEIDCLRERFLQSFYPPSFSELIGKAPRVYNHGLRPGLRAYQVAVLLEQDGAAGESAARPLGEAAIAGAEAVFDGLGLAYAIFESPIQNNRLYTAIGHEGAPPDMRRMADAIRRGLASRGTPGLVVGLGLPQASFEEIAESYREASAALEQRAIRDAGRVMLYEAGGKHGVMPADVVAREQAFLVSLELCNAEEMYQNTRGLFAALVEHSQITYRQVYRLCCQLLILTERILAKYELSFETIFKQDVASFEYVASHASLLVLERWFTKTIDSVMEQIAVRRQGSALSAVDEVVAYIADHLREDLTLAGLADMFHINKSYLSVLFKKRTGTTFIGYVTQRRMELAAELLRSQNAKVYEIAEHLSYVDVRYFSRLFYRAYGMSPGDYRKKYGAAL